MHFIMMSIFAYIPQFASVANIHFLVTSAVIFNLYSGLPAINHLCCPLLSLAFCMIYSILCLSHFISDPITYSHFQGIFTSLYSKSRTPPWLWRGYITASFILLWYICFEFNILSSFLIDLLFQSLTSIMSYVVPPSTFDPLCTVKFTQTS